MQLLKITPLTFLVLTTVFILPSLSFGASEFEKWKKEELESYTEFRDERDKAFTQYLKEQWQEFKLFQGEKPYKKPKPVKIPVVKKDPARKIVPFKGNVVKEIPLPAIPRKPKRPKKLEEIIPPLLVKKGKKLNFDFYGMSVVMNYDPKLKAKLSGKVNKDSISSYWESLSKPDYEDLLMQLDYFKKELKLNDWGYHLFVYRVGEKIYGPSKKETTLFVWFILSKSGYETKIGYNNNTIFLLLPTKNKLYSIPYLTLDDNRYYALSFDGRAKKLGSLYTYKGKYPGASDWMDYDIKTTPAFAKKRSSRSLDFSYGGKKFIIPVEYDKAVVEFFEFYPQTNFEVYFAATTSPEAGTSLIKALKPIVEGKTEGEAVNIILRFVQTAFKYKTDNGQFGREKYMLPDETLFYPYSDCEDRSIIFAYLVKNLTGLKVVALHYPNHIATAVKFNDEIEGDYVIYAGQKYLVCDPTYINADIGMAMPKFKKVNAKIIPIEPNGE
ncbi:MAG: hypothetical protein IME96_09115 [Proteobacteria bacterium]|nr:hypothetical protein [Pseudomonadota bacterium]